MAKSSALLSDSPLWMPANALAPPSSSPYDPVLVSCLKPLIPNGLLRGSIVEISGSRSSGRTAAALAILAEISRAAEVCAVIDVAHSFSPNVACDVGVQLSHVLWIRCNQNPDHALRATDLLLHAGGFSLIWLDFCEVPLSVLNRIPISYWHRFRRVVENTPVILLICADVAQVKSSFVNHLDLESEGVTVDEHSLLSPWLGLRSKGIWKQAGERRSNLLWVQA